MKKDKLKILKWIVGIILLAVFLYIMIKYGQRLRHLRIRQIKRYILGYGDFASIIYLVLYSLKPIALFIPVSMMSIVAGNVFGPYKALMLSMIGCFTSGTLAFFLAKFLGRSFVDRVLKGKAMNLDSNIEKYGLRIMIIMRLAFVFPYDPLSYAAGLSKMKYRDFIIGSMIGVFPEIVSYSFMGQNLEHPFSLRFAMPIISIIIIAIIAFYVHKSIGNSKN